MGWGGCVLDRPMAGMSLHVVDPRVQCFAIEAESLVVPTGPNSTAIECLAHACLESPDHRCNTVAPVRHNPVRHNPVRMPRLDTDSVKVIPKFFCGHKECQMKRFLFGGIEEDRRCAA